MASLPSSILFYFTEFGRVVAPATWNVGYQTAHSMPAVSLKRCESVWTESTQSRSGQNDGNQKAINASIIPKVCTGMLLCKA